MTDRVREALEPFAKAADNYADYRDDARFVDNDATITVGNLRDARQAFAALASEPGVRETAALQIGDKVKIADTAEYWSDWKGWEGFISGIRTNHAGVQVYETCDAWPPAEKVERTDGFVRADLVALSCQQPAAERLLISASRVREIIDETDRMGLGPEDFARRVTDEVLKAYPRSPSPQKTEG